MVIGGVHRVNRHDQDSEGGSTNNPRVGLIYKLTPDLTTKVLYGTAFRPANAFERYYVADTSRYKTVPGLRSETIKTYELAAEYFPRPDLRATASVYSYKLDNLISLVTDPADNLLYYRNADSATARGLELEAEYLGAGGSRLKTSVSLQRARNDATGERLTNSPAQLFKLNYSMPVWKQGARAAVELQHTSGRSTILGGQVGAFTVVNLTLSAVRLTPSLELSASIYNLFDKQYADPPSDEHFDNSTPPRFLQTIRQDGRTARVGLTWRF